MDRLSYCDIKAKWRNYLRILQPRMLVQAHRILQIHTYKCLRNMFRPLRMLHLLMGLFENNTNQFNISVIYETFLYFIFKSFVELLRHVVFYIYTFTVNTMFIVTLEWFRNKSCSEINLRKCTYMETE